MLGFPLDAGFGILLDSNRRLLITLWQAGVFGALAQSQFYWLWKVK